MTALNDGDNPALCHCRICGSVCIPKYEGFYRDAVCSRECQVEFQWRDTLKVLKKPYHRENPEARAKRT